MRRLYIDTLTAWPAGAVPEANCTGQTGQKVPAKGALQEGRGEDTRCGKRQPRPRRHPPRRPKRTGQEWLGTPMAVDHLADFSEHLRRHLVLARCRRRRRVRSAQRLAAVSAPRTSRDQRRGVAAAGDATRRRNWSTNSPEAERRRGPDRRPGARVLGARRTPHPGEGRGSDRRPRRPTGRRRCSSGRS